MPPLLWPSYSFLLKTFINFQESRGFICTHSLAYTFLLAFIPFSIATASISDWLPFSNSLVDEVQTYFFSRFLPQSGTDIYDLFKLSFRHSTRLSIVGVISLLVTTYGMMFAIEQHIHQMWHLKRQRKILQTLFIFSGFFILGPIITYSIAYIYRFISAKLNISVEIQYIISECLSILITTSSFIAVYKFIPNKKVSWRYAVISGVIAAGLFSILRWVFVISMINLKEEYSLLYGSLVTLPIFLLWIYLNSFIFLYCAQIIYVAEKRKNRKLKKIYSN